MDPIVSLHYYAPVCACINACIIPFTEGLEPFYALGRVGAFTLLTNAGVAFALNVSHRELWAVMPSSVPLIAAIGNRSLLSSSSVSDRV
jgi:energy-coupling factor transporter transmembrane protein EcfT